MKSFDLIESNYSLVTNQQPSPSHGVCFVQSKIVNVIFSLNVCNINSESLLRELDEIFRRELG